MVKIKIIEKDKDTQTEHKGKVLESGPRSLAILGSCCFPLVFLRFCWLSCYTVDGKQNSPLLTSMSDSEQYLRPTAGFGGLEAEI